MNIGNDKMIDVLKVSILMLLTAIGAVMLGARIGFYEGVKSVTCLACQECGYRLPGLEMIDNVQTVTDKETLKRIAMKETRGRHYEVIRGKDGEVGMMQIHPIHGDECYGLGDPVIEENNIKCGDLVFQNCLRLHKGNKPAALCCYNGAEPGCDYAEKVKGE